MKQPEMSRRRLLQMLAGAPLLPLSTLAGTSALLSGCGGSDGDSAAGNTLAGSGAVTLAGVTFSSTPAPTLATAAAMATTSVSSIMTVAYSNASKMDFKLAYQPFFITGDLVADGNGGKVVAGGYVDINSKP